MTSERVRVVKAVKGGFESAEELAAQVNHPRNISVDTSDASTHGTRQGHTEAESARPGLLSNFACTPFAVSFNSAKEPSRVLCFRHQLAKNCNLPVASTSAGQAHERALAGER